MTPIASHKQYLICAARAVCLVCPNKECRRDKDAHSTCSYLLEFRDAYKNELGKIVDKTEGKNTKVCKICGKEKPLSEFSRCYRYKDGFHNYCKECNSKRSKELYQRGMHRKATSLDNTKKVRILKECHFLLGPIQAVTTDPNAGNNLRYKLDEEYRKGMKEYAKRDYYDDNYYLARKYLKRAEKGLEKAASELEQIRSDMEHSEGRDLYILKRKENTRIAKIESYKYKIELCRSIVEGKVSLTQEDIEKAGIFHVKSSLLERLKKRVSHTCESKFGRT